MGHGGTCMWSMDFTKLNKWYFLNWKIWKTKWKTKQQQKTTKIKNSSLKFEPSKVAKTCVTHPHLEIKQCGNNSITTDKTSLFKIKFKVWAIDTVTKQVIIMRTHPHTPT